MDSATKSGSTKSKSWRSAFTLVELPAVSRKKKLRFYFGRTAGRDRHHWHLDRALAAGRPSCPRSRSAVAVQNNLKQIGLAAMTHLDTQKHFPTSGWGYHWVGDPDRGYGLLQPGGWAYNLLDYMEEKQIRVMGKGITPATTKYNVLAQMVNMQVATLVCPLAEQSEWLAER